MRKSLLVAAAFTLTTATAMIEPAKASSDGSGGSSPQFTVAAPTAGAITFQGDGTAQFNNSLGTNNSFQVGSSTNLGVNASASSTAEYGVTAGATLDMGADSVLKQVIGTSGNAQSKTSTSTAAHEVARNHMRSTDIGVEWDQNVSGRYSSQGDWQLAYDTEYNNTFSNAYSNIKSKESSANQSGTISGEFKTKETGSATTSGSLADFQASAKAEAERSYGSSYDSSSSNYSFSNSSEWQAAYDAEYNRAYGAAAAGAQRTSESEVTVNGIGSDASVTAATTSQFDVQITQNTGMNFGSTATANGSSGASLATSSFANQSNASTASGFMQAFGM
jgi:hypothetical protein